MTVTGLSDPGLPAPNVLFCCRATPDYYRRPLFSPREVFCGPDCTDVEADGRTVSLKTAAGEYDLAAVVARLPASQRPDLVVVKADATRGNFPRNLDRLRCPKVLLVGDTHHFEAPVRALLRYASVETFDLTIVDHTRHHAHFFRAAGFERIYWIPALDYAPRRRSIPDAPSRPLTFIGQSGAFHPYRRHVLETVRRAGLPLEVLRASPEETADFQADSGITLNVSLNGDLNLRVFEALAAGAFLVTDALTPESGLDRLFEAGRHLETYRSSGELVERIRHYLARPEEARRIREAGQAHLFATQSPAVKLRQFYGLVWDGRADPALEIETRGAVPVGREALLRRIAAYEAVQSVHLRARRLTLYVGPDDPLGLADTARDLPRVRILGHGNVLAGDGLLPAGEEGARDEEALVLPWPESAGVADLLMTRFRGDLVLVAPRGWRDREAAATALAVWGFTPADGEGVSMRCTDPLAAAERAVALDPERAQWRIARLADLVHTATDAFRGAAIARKAGDTAAEEQLLERCVALDRGHADALAALARLAAGDGRHADAALFAAEAMRESPANAPGMAELRELAEASAAKASLDRRVSAYREVFATTDRPSCGRPRRVLVVTNLFPPQEFGGYGRKLWEFSCELRRRGHDVRVLAGDVSEFGRPGAVGSDDLEPLVERSLELYGRWEGGVLVLDPDPARREAVARRNDARILEAVRRFGSEVCLVGNIDLLGDGVVSILPEAGIPVIHCVGNRTPGYVPDRIPCSPLYRLGPASEWVGRTLAENGYGQPEATVLYPGARVDSFYRPFPPAFDRLRIAFASLFVNYKGPHVLVNALAVLARAGIDFTCTFAGETPDATLLANARDYCTRNGLTDRVRFSGFLDRRGMADLLARSNVLVFPSVFDEPFGISHVEAMAAGVAVVSSGTGGSREIVRDGVDGLLFRRDDHLDLAAKLVGLPADPLRWTSLARAGQARAFAFTVACTVDRIESLFGELMARAAAR